MPNAIKVPFVQNPATLSLHDHLSSKALNTSLCLILWDFPQPHYTLSAVLELYKHLGYVHKPWKDEETVALGV